MTSLRRTLVRTRLTIWYLGVLSAALLLFLGGTSVLLFWQLRWQLSHYAVQDVETVEGLLFFDSAGRLVLRENYHNHPESKRVLERLLEVRAPDGAVLYRNQRLGNRSLGGTPFPGEGVGGYSERSVTLPDGTEVRMVSRRHLINGRPIVMRLAYGEEPLWRDLWHHLGASLIMLPLTLAVAGFAGYGLACRALAPLQQMTRQAERITLERLNERLPVDREDEIGQLARVFNSMLARLEQSFDQLRRFTSDASHELRTPLAAMRSVGEVGLQRDASREEYRDVIGSMLEEVNRLSRLTDSLLTMSRADAGALQFHKSTFPLLELANEATALLQVLMEEKAQKLVMSGDESAMVEADRLFLRQALVNIVHNAIKYSPVEGTIHVEVRRLSGKRVTVEITDSGPGIPPEHASKVFDRFYRVDKSRSRSAGGTGLGLSIAQWAVQAHGGSIGLESKPGAGATFQIILPAAC